MDRAEWMYKIPRAGNDLTFLHHVTKFIADAKKTSYETITTVAVSLGWPK